MWHNQYPSTVIHCQAFFWPTARYLLAQIVQLMLRDQPLLSRIDGILFRDLLLLGLSQLESYGLRSYGEPPCADPHERWCGGGGELFVTFPCSQVWVSSRLFAI